MIKTTTLENGIRVITDKQRDAVSVTLGVWINVGSRNERQEINGISHFLEHMSFQGTKTRSHLDISRQIEDVGGIINAYTGRDITAYHVRLLKENTNLGLDVIADIVQNSVMNKDRVEKEKGVILQEINMTNDTPDKLVFDLYNEAAYPDQPLGRPILGPAETVKKIISQDLSNYRNTQYTANRMIISAVGNINHEEFVEACRQRFTNVSTHTMPDAEKAVYQEGERRLNKPNEQVNLVLGFEGASYTHPDYYTERVLANILGGDSSSRLYQEIREKRGLVYSIVAFGSAEKDTGFFGVYAGTGEKEVQELMPVLCDELARLPHTLNEEEIARAKATFRARLLMQQENKSSSAHSNAVDTLVRGRIVTRKELIRQIQKITKEDLERVASRIISSPLSFAALGPIKKVMPFDKIRERIRD